MDTSELLSLSIDDIELILQDQRDLYSEDEFAFLEKRLVELLEEQNRIALEERKKQIPSTILCPKCDGENPSSNQVCQYCSYKFKKRDYYQQHEYEMYDPVDEDSDEDRSNTGLYVIAFLLPIVGIIMGLIYIGKNEDDLGKSLIMFSIIISIVFAVIGWLFYYFLLGSIFSLAF